MNQLIPVERIESKILFIRGQKVMLDRDLAGRYGVKTKVLKQAVRRNISRFPEDFMFELTKEEFENWRSQFVTSNSDKMGLRYKPFVFTEHGILMLSSVLNSERAIQYKKDYPTLEWFVDARQLRPMDPQDVDWVAKEILPKFGEAGLTREAFVIPQNAMAKLAVHQYETKAADGKVAVRMFGSVEEAKQWLKEAHL